MINAIADGLLQSDLEADTLDIVNCKELAGADNVVETTDSSLTNRRTVLDGSVNDASVANDAAIKQSKLSLNGVIPTDWLGTTDTTAARGDLVQFQSEKDQPNGYASIGMDGKLPNGSTPLSGTGTITNMDIEFPLEFTVVPDVSTPAWNYAVLWNAIPPFSWFGNATLISAPPKFNTIPLPISLIPDLDAAQFATETFDTDRLPLAVGVGVDHAVGMIPLDSDSVGLKSDYLARDMTFRRMETTISYQPVLPDPAITILYYVGPVAMMGITQSVKSTNLFYKIAEESATFTQIMTQPIQVSIGATIMVYASKTGYTNSNVVSYVIPDPST